MKSIFYAPVFIFVLFMIFLITFELYHGKHNYNVIMQSRADEIINTVTTYREWAADVGMIYADAEKIPPNPFLEWRSDRDVYTENLHLTMLNPSYMTRLVSNLLNEHSGFTLRMVGVDAMNHFNEPSEWELRGFDAFKSGLGLYTDPENGALLQKSFRYMKPLFTTEACIPCHLKQGFQVGDLIGGISIEMPGGKVASILLHNTVRNITVYTVISLILLVSVTLLQNKIYSISSSQEENINNLNKEIKRRQLSEEALVQQTRIASQGELLSLVAHHWRQPLNVVSLTLDMIREEIEDVDPDNNYSFKNIDESLALIQDLSTSIDVFSKRFAKDDENSYFNSTNIIMETINIMEPLMVSMNIKLWLKCSTEDSDTDICLCTKDMRDKETCIKDDVLLEGSSNQFSQILLTLLKNSYEAILDHRYKESEIRQGAVHISVFSTKTTFTMSVIDNGCGFTPEAASRAFEPYYTTKGYDYGRGTGLYFAKNLAHKFEDGDLMIDSDYEYTKVVFKAKRVHPQNR
ncbi:integral membrane sensor signal transduction histidine kinase [Denitrovibrio acetiphilus DSM 12809]|uniref:histidine kinase n=1 Tax=Denitrovibrio acetiphilus (strain DSM 12809 / NBRC 114555 / N2460) TaxID=522772 RepID=D4H481_DENA2|nr:DUF3365 domain-containing protein [Denitrovibrio acetiphilus]ADD69210.1 integral membrane sensor signal transduction histidine kinase [Denitrovibrio acetiphilus DSM 12809]